MKLFYVLMSAFFAFCVMANDLPVKSLEDYESELREKYPFVERKIGDNVHFYIDGKTEVSGKVTEINDNGVMVENNGTEVFYSFQQLGIFGGRFFQKEKYDQWITRFAKVKMAQAAKLEARKLAKQRKAEQKKAEQQKDKQDNPEEKKKTDAANGIYMINDRINGAFGIWFGRSLKDEIARLERANEIKHDILSITLTKGSYPDYGFIPNKPFVAIENGEQKIIGEYDVSVVGKGRIAYKVEIDEIKPKYVEDIIGLLKKKYGNFEIDLTKLNSWDYTFRLISKINPERSIIISRNNNTMGGIRITFYCKDIEDRFKEKTKVKVSW